MAVVKLSKSLIAISDSVTSVKKESWNKSIHEVFVGNLKYDVSTRVIICKMQQLFKNIDLHVPEFRFTVFQRKSKKHPRKYAFIVFPNETEERIAYQLDGMENLDFVVDGLKLLVCRRKSMAHKESKKIQLTFDGKHDVLTKSRSAPLLGSKDDQDIEDYFNPNIQEDKELYYGQCLHVEDRVTEYKRGSGNYMKNMLIPHIRKYICAFLNSEGGRLMIGVDDNCKVHGIYCNRKQEDKARCLIDNTIKQFQPHVVPTLYNVEFIPVKLTPNDGIELDSMDPLLKVLEVSICKPCDINSLYENDKGEIFIRRDGSVEGPLKTSQIIDWCRVNFATKSDKECSCDQDDVILARQSYMNSFDLDRLEKTLNETLNRIEDQIKQMQDICVLKEKLLRKKLAKSKLDLAKTNTELQSLRMESYFCNIV